MVRRCCVVGCTETDLSILAHRFPKPENVAQKWQENLNLESISLEDLQRGSYVVCTRHFKPSDYRNVNSNCLNTTAVPNHEKNTDNQRIITTKFKPKLKQLVTAPNSISHKTTPSAKRPSLMQIKDVVTIKKIKVDTTTMPKENEDYKNFDIVDELDLLYEDDEAISESQINYQCHEQSTMTETAEFKDQAIQTAHEKMPLSNQSDKDDKIIALLYPKYASSSKIELVKMLIERELKITSLEEKEKQLEKALESLL